MDSFDWLQTWCFQDLTEVGVWEEARAVTIEAGQRGYSQNATGPIKKEKVLQLALLALPQNQILNCLFAFSFLF